MRSHPLAQVPQDQDRRQDPQHDEGYHSAPEATRGMGSALARRREEEQRQFLANQETTKRWSEQFNAGNGPMGTSV